MLTRGGVRVRITDQEPRIWRERNKSWTGTLVLVMVYCYFRQSCKVLS